MCDKRDKAITCVLCRDHVFCSLQKDMFKARKVKFGEKLFQTVYYYCMKKFCNSVVIQLNLKYLRGINTTERDHLLLHT